MGRRKKSAALNQIIEEPVEKPIAATPEQIEEIKTEGAKMMAEEVDKTIRKDFEDLREIDVVDLLEKTLAKEMEDIQTLEEGAGLKYSKDYVENPDVKHILVEKTPAAALMGDLPETEEKKMSVADKRRKLRYGMKPNK